jgi:hypothetical protein
VASSASVAARYVNGRLPVTMVLAFDAESARMYGGTFAAARAFVQSSRARLADLLIASTAAVNGLPLYTRNPSDFDALKRILKVLSAV